MRGCVGEGLGGMVTFTKTSSRSGYFFSLLVSSGGVGLVEEESHLIQLITKTVGTEYHLLIHLEFASPVGRLR